MRDKEEIEGLIEDLEAEILGCTRQINSLNDCIVNAKSEHERILGKIYSLETERQKEELRIEQAKKEIEEIKSKLNIS